MISGRVSPDISGRYRWTDVFLHRGGKWQIVASQSAPIQ